MRSVGRREKRRGGREEVWRGEGRFEGGRVRGVGGTLRTMTISTAKGRGRMPEYHLQAKGPIGSDSPYMWVEILQLNQARVQ